ncbi:MAG: hypothetical protein JO023_17875 [Chloroflexi bacterium]|nr:hypothetical protein [Chloroflexota bacterium]
MSEFDWPNEVPPTCPIPRSRTFSGVSFSGRSASYTDADTWYPSWAADGSLYSPWTDGVVDGQVCLSFAQRRVDKYLFGLDPEAPASTGQARIVGDDPLNLQVVNLGTTPGDPEPYAGRYPGGSLVHRGVWYYGTYTLDDIDGGCGNWCTLGPFVGFRTSTDFGHTWTDTPHTPAAPLFGESGRDGTMVRIGAPHVVDFGCDMEHSPDGKAYLLAHGASSRHGWANWIAGDAIYLLRVTPSIETINDPSAYEFFAGVDAHGQPRWAADQHDLQPLLRWDRHLGCVTATYDAPLDRYLMCVSRPADGHSSLGLYDTLLLEAEALTGPWRLIHYLHNFGRQAYFVNLPTKFISLDGAHLWLCYSANFSALLNQPQESNPPGSRYALCLQEFRLAD